MSVYVRIAEAPEFVLNYPSCGACLVDLEHDGDSFACPSCGSVWDSGANDGDKGELYEELDGPILTHDQAAAVASYRERLERHKRRGKDSPHLYPKPIRPRGLPEGLVL